MKRGLSILALVSASVISLEANPTGGDVAAGSATIAGQGSPTVTINQSSNTAIINWQTFSIGSGELTKFIQPSSSSATLNRVLGGQTSIIDGTLSANGQVFLLNGNGIIVGSGGVINTAGFTGSTRDISDSDFLSGNLHFVGSNNAGVANYGKISALGGDVVLIGKTVDNEGSIKASGTAALVAGDDILLAQQNPDGSTVTVDPVESASSDSQKVGVKNGGVIKASVAELKAANGNIYALAIQNTGVVQATTVKQQGGHIYLTADSGTIVNSGTLNASTKAAGGKGGTVLVKSTMGKVVHSGKILAQGGNGGTGGNVEISGAQVALTGSVDTTALNGTTGNLLLDPLTLDIVTGGGSDTTASTVDPTEIDSLLQQNNLTLTAENGITVSDALSWSSGRTLTLETTNPGSTLAINASITAVNDVPNGGLIIDLASATDVISATAAIEVGTFSLQRGAWVQVNSTLPGFTASTDFEILNGTFLRATGGNGTTGSPYVLTDVYGLQGVEGFLRSSFTSNGNVINALDAQNWNSGDGFAPIGSSQNPFTGTLTNLTVENLTINLGQSNDVGLVGVLGTNGKLTNVLVEDSSITGNDYVGALVGDNLGAILLGGTSGNTVTGVESVGGIAGYNESSASIGGTNSTGDLVSGQYYVGGVVGANDGVIDTVENDGAVTGVANDEEVNYNLGGIVGFNSKLGTVTNSVFGGTFTASGGAEAFDVGGIAGQNDGVISYSHTLIGSSLVADSDLGGIAGYNIGFIRDSYNNATLGSRTDFGQSFNIGGIAGENDRAGDTDPNQSYENLNLGFSQDAAAGGILVNSGVIQTSFNAGSVSGEEVVGGIVGLNDAEGSLNTVYNIGTIGQSDGNFTGGIAGDNYGMVAYTYSSGLVIGQSESDNVAAISGVDENGSATTHSYWDTSTTGQSVATNFYSGDSTLPNESDIGTVSTTDGTPGSAFVITDNNYGQGTSTNPGAGYAYFGSATSLGNGLYGIGVSPDDGVSPAFIISEGITRPQLSFEFSNYGHGLPIPGQPVSTLEGEIASLTNQFGNDPFNGIDPLFFQGVGNGYVTGSEEPSAVNDKHNKHDHDYAHASSTANLPGISRLITADSGVVEIIGGAVVIGDPETGKAVFLNAPGSALSSQATQDLQQVLAPNVYNELLAIINAK